jgi:high-affinity iron transporter
MKMLINTVILFLRDALPLFIILALLISLFEEKIRLRAWLPFALILGATLALILLANINWVSELFDGTGHETLTALLISISYVMVISLVILATNNEISIYKLTVLLIISGALSVITNGTDFLIFITGFWLNTDNATSLSLGIILGSGICFSISVLIYFLMHSLKERFSEKIIKAILVLYSAGQLGKITILLAQADLLPASSIAWNSDVFISDSKELGHLLSSLIGYESSPTYLHVGIYLLAIIIPCIFLLKQNSNSCEELKP